MYHPAVINKLGLIRIGKLKRKTVMYSLYMDLYLYDFNEAGRKLPENIYLVKQKIKNRTLVSYTNTVRILSGQDLCGYLN